ncbi:MAG: YhgE/Pip domain-containing protein, partial [Clostridium sp.]
MNFLKIAGKDIKSIFKNRIIRVSVIAIIIVPLLYSLLYLNAFWDPYSRLTNLPVAVVNLDEGTKLDGDKVNYGKDLVDELRNNTTVGWKFTKDEDANNGLSGDKYYSKFVIPKDFSEKVIAAKEGKPEVANLKFVCNEKKNFLSAQINSKIESELRQKIVETVTKNYVTASFDKLYEVKDGLVAASDGSKKMFDGIGTLNEKVPMLMDGTKSLKDGSLKLYNGQTELNSAISQVNKGLFEVNSKVPDLATGVSMLYNGSAELKSGMDTAKNGSGELSKGSEKLYDTYITRIYPAVGQLKLGANQLNTALGGTPKGNSKELENPSIALKNASGKISQASNNLQDGYKKVKGGVDELISGANASSDVMKSVAKDLQKAIESGDKSDIQLALQKIKLYEEANADTKSKLASLEKGTQNLNNSFNDYNNSVQGYTSSVIKYSDATLGIASSMTELKAGVSKLSNGLDSLEAGLNEKNQGSFGSGLKAVSENMTILDSGIGSLGNGSKSINTGLKELNSNIPMLSSGLSALYLGSGQMLNGSSALLDGQNKLNSGVSELASKVPELASGVGKLYDGSKELSTELSKGADKIKNGLVNSSNDMGEFVSSPVNMEIAPINPVPNYGTGFAPYFISLSLWIGAIMMFFVIPSKTDDDKNISRFNKVVGKFLSFAFVGVLQALLVGFVVMRLGLKPTNVVMYYGLLVFFSLVFIAIVQCLIFLFGDAGRLLSIVLLILQLT